MKLNIVHRKLIFKRPGGTSRGVLYDKDSWFIRIERNGKVGYGECAPLKGLSPEFNDQYESKLHDLYQFPENELDQIHEKFKTWPSLRFGMETAIQDLQNNQEFILFQNEFSAGLTGIPINGLIWMGTVSFMLEQIKNLLSNGFHCLKMKIGAIDFEDEIEILKKLRNEYNQSELILRVDANGAFSSADALEKLKRLSDFGIHSIEQPIATGQSKKMAELCEKSPLAIALDEELIGIHSLEGKETLLNEIKPQYIILKPSLIGGFQSGEEWIAIAEKLNIDWWVTSALESNIGLNAIAQWTKKMKASGYQGLGTGSLFTNNIACPLRIEGEKLIYRPGLKWEKHDLFGA